MYVTLLAMRAAFSLRYVLVTILPHTRFFVCAGFPFHVVVVVFALRCSSLVFLLPFLIPLLPLWSAMLLVLASWFFFCRDTYCAPLVDSVVGGGVACCVSLMSWPFGGSDCWRSRARVRF